MFEWTSAGAYGNDFYIDQVQITNSQAIGIEDPVVTDNDYKVYPNPMSSSSQIYVNLPLDADVTIDVLDLTGRQIHTVYSGQLGQGESLFELQREDLGAAGIYMIRLNVNGVSSVKKIVLE